jgi:hypothetical protein
MGRRHKIWYTPGVGCSICGSKHKGDLASPGFPSFGQLACGPCLVVGGKFDPPLHVLSSYERLGWLEDSRKVFRKKGLAVLY